MRTREPAIDVARRSDHSAIRSVRRTSLPCVPADDINPAVVTKLSDRGSAQTVGVVTDVGLFLKQLALQLAPGG